MVETVLDKQGLLGVFCLLAVGCSRSGSGQASFLLLLRLRPVLVKELEQLGSGVLIQGVLELRDCWGNLQTLAENDLLALETDILGPFHEAGKVGFGEDALACVRVRQNAPRTAIQINTPMPKFLGVDSNKGFLTTFEVLLAPNGAGAGFLPDLVVLGGWSLRREGCLSATLYAFQMKRTGAVWTTLGALVLHLSQREKNTSPAINMHHDIKDDINVYSTRA